MKLIGWYGNGNLGDDEMANILRRRFPDVSDKWTLISGGTLISPLSDFMPMVTDPEHTIGVSMGVSSNWSGQWLDILSKIRHIYCRDYFSYFRLKDAGLTNITLSFDLWCVLAPKPSIVDVPKRVPPAWGNFIDLSRGGHDEYLISLSDHLRRSSHGYKRFAMSTEEDLRACPEARLFTDGAELVQTLRAAPRVITTRLHAAVAAWIAGVPNIHPIFYDPKVCHFFERVAGYKPYDARLMVEKHLDEIAAIMCA